jgi:hypothetical protein
MQNNSNNLNEIVYLYSNGKIILKIDRSEISKLNYTIIKFLNSNYNKYGFNYGDENKEIEIENVILHTEYLSKFVNNRTLFGKIIEKYKLKNVEEFISYIKNNLSRLYDFDGADFQDNYDLVKNTALKGKRGENACKKKFEKMLFDEYNIEYKIKTSNTSDDISGLDGEFDFNGIPVTLQIKPFTKSIKKNGKIIVYSNGAMNFNTNYLLLYRETSVKGKYYRYDYIFLKNGKNFDKISYDNGRYETSVDYIIYP